MWKDINNYEGLYLISDKGQVKSLKSNKILKPFYSGKGYNVGQGYATVALWKDGKRKMRRIHRLVAEHFIPNPNNYKEVNHKDEDKTNNCAENLEWCTRQYNVNYGTTKERMIQSQHNKPILQCDIEGNIIKRYKSRRELEENGFPSSSVTKFIKENRSYAGYIFKYEI
jgi:hypothetical protein